VTDAIGRGVSPSPAGKSLFAMIGVLATQEIGITPLSHLRRDGLNQNGQSPPTFRSGSDGLEASQLRGAPVLAPPHACNVLVRLIFANSMTGEGNTGAGIAR